MRAGAARSRAGRARRATRRCDQAIAGRSTRRQLSHAASTDSAEHDGQPRHERLGKHARAADGEQDRQVPEVEAVRDDARAGERPPGEPVQDGPAPGRHGGDHEREARRRREVAQRAAPAAEVVRRLHPDRVADDERGAGERERPSSCGPKRKRLVIC